MFCNPFKAYLEKILEDDFRELNIEIEEKIDNLENSKHLLRFVVDYEKRVLGKKKNILRKEVILLQQAISVLDEKKSVDYLYPSEVVLKHFLEFCATYNINKKCCLNSLIAMCKNVVISDEATVAELVVDRLAKVYDDKKLCILDDEEVCLLYSKLFDLLKLSNWKYGDYCKGLLSIAKTNSFSFQQCFQNVVFDRKQLEDLDKAQLMISGDNLEKNKFILNYLRNIISVCRYLNINEDVLVNEQMTDVLIARMNSLHQIVKNGSKYEASFYYLMDDDLIPYVVKQLEILDVIYYDELESLVSSLNKDKFVCGKKQKVVYELSSENVSLFYTLFKNKVVLLGLMNKNLNVRDDILTDEVVAKINGMKNDFPARDILVMQDKLFLQTLNVNDNSLKLKRRKKK